MLPPLSLEQSIDAIVREEWGRILSILVKDFRDFQLAEDCLQDAIVAALRTWKTSGLPGSPAGWLILTARRKAIDRLRRKNTATANASEISYLKDLENTFIGDDVDALPDKRLKMMFTCCHPALSEKTRIALTLRTIGGLTTQEIATAFLDNSKAMGQRLSRAKSKIQKAGIPYIIPDKSVFPERLKGVLAVIYLIFNEGYSSSSETNLIRAGLVTEALRLARIINHLMPETAEIEGLLALMLLHDARSGARVSSEGQMIPLEHQNRKTWHPGKISEGRALVKRALARAKVGPYQIQAAISALHSEAQTWADTDWPQISALYNLLYAIQPSPVVLINAALAKSYAVTPQAGLIDLQGLEDHPDIQSYQPYYAAKADILSRAGQTQEAQHALGQAIALSTNKTEREFLRSKLPAKS